MGIRWVATGLPFVSPSMTAALLDRRARTTAFKKTLSSTETRILGNDRGRQVYKEWPRSFTSPRTVETHRASICAKLEISGANSLLEYALEHKWKLLG